MQSTFIALPLRSGEAFLLRAPDTAGRIRTILIDSGKYYSRTKRELATRLAQVSPRIEHIDIAVCTHSDADHSQGFWYFADDWYDLGRAIGEFWLPGRWANAMPFILTDPEGFAAKLFEGVLEATSRVRETKGELSLMRTPREVRLYNTLSRTNRGREDEGLSTALQIRDGGIENPPHGAEFALTPEETQALRAEFEETDHLVDPFAEAVAFFKHRAGSWFKVPAPSWSERFFWARAKGYVQALFAEVAETAKAIRKIAMAALAREIRIRWFDFGKFQETGKPSGGIPGFLEPICAVEVVPVSMKTAELSAIALFASLRLSCENVESLVFYHPETSDRPGVLFLGDSRLAHGLARPAGDFLIPFSAPEGELLVTAPHHGSDLNDNAFRVVSSWLKGGTAYYVRNGGQSNQKLGAFLDVRDRRCAQCVQCHGKDWNQWVTVTSSGGRWNWPPSAEPCGAPRI